MSPPELKAQGNAAFKRKEFEAAESLYTLALEAARNSGDTVTLAESLHNRGMCKLKRSLYSEALADFRDAFHARPAYSKARLAAAGVHLEHIGDPAAAVRLLQEALTLPACELVPEVKAKLEAAQLALSMATQPGAGVELEPPLPSTSVSALSASPIDALKARLERASVVAAAAPPPPREQRFHIARLSAQYDAVGVCEGAEYAIVPNAWWEDWAAHVGGFSTASDIAPLLRILKQRNSLDFGIDDAVVIEHYPAVAAAAYTSAAEPEPLRVIDCMALIDVEATAAGDAAIPAPVLYGAANEGSDFRVVGLEVFRALAAWHGTRGPPLVRVAVRMPPTDGVLSPDCIIDLRPELQRYSKAAPSVPASASPVPAAVQVPAAAATEVDAAEIVAATTTVLAAAPPMTPPPSSASAAAGAALLAAPTASKPASGEVAKVCPRCDASPATNKCSRCRSVYYCSEACQRAHWQQHKKVCAAAVVAAPPTLPAAPKVLNGRVGLTNLGNTWCVHEAGLCRPPFPLFFHRCSLATPSHVAS